MYEDIMVVIQKSDCKFRKCEIVYLLWFKYELNGVMLRWDEDKIDVKVEDVVYGNEVMEMAVKKILSLLQFRRIVMGSIWYFLKKGGLSFSMY